MAKRYIDTGFYKHPFTRGLKGSLKGLYSFIICDCSGSGIWAKDLEVASIYVGLSITENEWFECFVKTGKAIDLENGKFFFPDFIEHQYPKGLSETNPAHSNFILELKKYNLLDESLKPLRRPFEGSKVMVMVKVMEEVKVNGKCNSKEEIKKEKEIKFRKEAEIFKDQYGEEMIKEFCDYWTESNQGSSKLKFEFQKIFDISRRLVTWNNNNFNKKNGNNGQSKNNTISEDRRQTVSAILNRHAKPDSQ